MSPDVSRCHDGLSCLSSWRGRNTWMTHRRRAALSLLWSWKSPVCCVSSEAGCSMPGLCAATRTGTRGLSAVTGAWARPVSCVRLGWRQEPSLWWLVSDQSASIVTRDRDILLLLLKPVKTTVTQSHNHNWSSENTRERRRSNDLLLSFAVLIFLQVKWPAISEVTNEEEWDRPVTFDKVQCSQLSFWQPNLLNSMYVDSENKEGQTRVLKFVHMKWRLLMRKCSFYVT